jgi:hypothetical protein
VLKTVKSKLDEYFKERNIIIKEQNLMPFVAIKVQLQIVDWTLNLLKQFNESLPSTTEQILKEILENLKFCVKDVRLEF